MIDDLVKTQYQRFVEERIYDDVTTFHNTISNYKLPLFSNFENSQAARHLCPALTVEVFFYWIVYIYYLWIEYPADIKRISLRKLRNLRWPPRWRLPTSCDDEGLNKKRQQSLCRVSIGTLRIDSTAAAFFVRAVVLVFLTNATVGNSGRLVATIFA